MFPIKALQGPALERWLRGGGGGAFIYSGSNRLVSFEIKFKELSWAEPEFMIIYKPSEITEFQRQPWALHQMFMNKSCLKEKMYFTLTKWFEIV